jgi:ATP-binding protein involved in chromosome partitioning
LNVAKNNDRTPLTESDVRTAVEALVDPVLEMSLGKAGFVQAISVDDAEVQVQLELPSPVWRPRNELKSRIHEALESKIGERSLKVVFASRVLPSRPEAAAGENLIPGAKNVVLFASGKGGVGKSTVAVNVAAALADAGAKVGLLDADIYGPSIPTMFGAKLRPEVVDNRLIPVTRYGIKLMSIGFIVNPEEAMVWRGPMLTGALMQFMRDVEWGELDYIILDLPPGTGDVQLTLAQNIKVSGAVLVSTPQDVALMDVVRGKTMFDKVGIPILGVVENMASFTCGSCGTVHHIFAEGGARKLAEKLRLPVLAEVPLEVSARESADSGRPEVLSHPDSASSLAFKKVAEAIGTELGKTAHRAAAAPKSSGLKIIQ